MHDVCARSSLTSENRLVNCDYYAHVLFITDVCVDPWWEVC